jgi:hypothetical protein
MDKKVYDRIVRELQTKVIRGEVTQTHAMALLQLIKDTVVIRG